MRAGDWGLEGPDGRVVFPPTAPAGLEYFNPAGAYLIDNSRILVLWLGVQLHPHFYQEVRGGVGCGGVGGWRRLSTRA